MEQGNNDVLRVPERTVPVPWWLSPEAKAQMGQPFLSNPPWPAMNDDAAWREYIARQDAQGAAGLALFASGIEAEVEELDVEGVRIWSVTPAGMDHDDATIYLDIHGGALLWGGGESCRSMGMLSAAMMGSRVWAVDYRMPPDHPYPAGLDDCVTAYRVLLRERAPNQIAVGGASAGGNLAAAAILRARDEGLPLPAACVMLTPEVDLTESGDSFTTLLGLDTGLTSRLMPANLLYAGGHDLADPYLSPLFGDFAKGFPPTILASGTRDLFLSNTVRMHRALRQAGVPADLHVWDAATHIGFAVGPEADDKRSEVRAFLDRWLGRGMPAAKQRTRPRQPAPGPNGLDGPAAALTEHA